MKTFPASDRGRCKAAWALGWAKILFLTLGLGLAADRLAPEGRAQPAVALAWSPSTNPFTTGYYLAWGTNTNNMTVNTYLSPVTNGVISNLIYGVTYYFAVACFSSNLAFEPVPASSYTANLSYSTNSPSALVTVNDDAEITPPLPPLPPGMSRPGGSQPSIPETVPAPPGGSSFSYAASAAPTPAASPSASATNITQNHIFGIPPLLAPAVNGGRFILTIQGTVGSTLAVQCTTNSDWGGSFTVTNVPMTTVASAATKNVAGQTQDAIDLAFVPSEQTIALPEIKNIGAAMQIYRVAMSNDYPILASRVLPAKGYGARLIMVNMPGGIVDDCCYVSQAGGYIHYNAESNTMQLHASGSTIRQIADSMASLRNMDWTTASEFTYTNGCANILATVVEADAPSSDPVAGSNVVSSIVIDF